MNTFRFKMNSIIPGFGSEKKLYDSNITGHHKTFYNLGSVFRALFEYHLLFQTNVLKLSLNKCYWARSMEQIDFTILWCKVGPLLVDNESSTVAVFITPLFSLLKLWFCGHTHVVEKCCRVQTVHIQMLNVSN